MTYRELCRCLVDGGIDCAEREAALLAEHFCGVSMASLMADPQKDLGSEALEAAVTRRLTREPLAYILGEWSFFEEQYLVSPACLIPRPETELLVEQAISLLPQGAHFADLCTGSGCIAVSTLCHRPDCRATALDLFPETAALAQKNARRNGVSHRLRVTVGDVLDPLCLSDDGPFDAVLSNPPYIQTRVVDGLEPELFHEPRAALDGGDDGMLFYRRIVSTFLGRLKPQGFFLFEIGYDQQADILALAESHALCGKVLPDLSGNPRVAILHH